MMVLQLFLCIFYTVLVDTVISSITINKVFCILPDPELQT